jgi:hypothetical protein
MIHPESGSRIRAAVPISDVVGSYVRLKKSGPDDLTGLCPFHQEKTPSFKVHPQAGFFKCFGCGKVGDVITFVKEIERKTFPEVIESLAQQYGVDVSPDGKKRVIPKQSEGTRKALKFEFLWFWWMLRWRQWSRIKMAEKEGRRLMSWMDENYPGEEAIPSDVGRAIDSVLTAAEIAIQDAQSILAWEFGLTDVEKMGLYVKVRSSDLQDYFHSHRHMRTVYGALIDGGFCTEEVIPENLVAWVEGWRAGLG